METKRSLSEDEIKFIVSELPYPKAMFPAVRESALSLTKDMFISQLHRIKIYPSLIGQLKSKIEYICANAIVPTGEMVGVLASHTMETFTQMTLNMFHSAGLADKDVSLGLPRFEETLNATQHPKIIGFNFIPLQLYTNSSDLRSSIRLPHVTFEMLLLRWTFQNVSDLIKEPWYEIFDQFYSTEYQRCQYRVRCRLDIGQLFKYDLCLADVASSIENNLETLFVVFGPLETGIVDIYADTKEIYDQNNTMTDEETKKLYFNNMVIPTVKKLSISGIPGITAVYPKLITEAKVEKWTFDGNGGSLIDLLSHPQADSTKTINDNMWDIYDCLGIEATRNFIIRELTNIMSFDGTFVNPKHIELIADRMLIDGKISPVTRYGMEKAQFGTYAKSCFERQFHNFMVHGAHGSVDDMKGVTAAIVTGSTPKCGTGVFDVLVDLEKISQADPVKPTFVEF